MSTHADQIRLLNEQIVMIHDAIQHNEAIACTASQTSRRLKDTEAKAVKVRDAILSEVESQHGALADIAAAVEGEIS